MKHSVRSSRRAAGMLAYGLAVTSAAAAANEWSSNLRWSVDVASRVVDMRGQSDLATAGFIGLDLHKVFSGDAGDIGTLTLQPYLIRIDNMAMHPPFFDGPDDWEVEYRIVNFNFTGVGGGRTNFRIGHFEIPFGLEQIVNTNGTLRDYLHGPNLGLKADWGVTFNGETARFDYELALSRGSGNNWETRGSTGLWSGRIGTSRSRQWVIGASFVHGNVQDLSQPDFTMQRSRFALDAQWFGPRMNVKAELTNGDDESRGVATALVELDVLNASETLLTYLQWRAFDRERTGSLPSERSSSAGLGLRYTPDNRLWLEMQYDFDLQAAANGGPMRMLAAQARYRF